MNASVKLTAPHAFAPAGNEGGATASRSARLRQMLLSDQLEFIMEAHNGLSARIVREAGFKGIWGSGLSISAQFGVRDNNEASWTQVVDMLEFMAHASDLPILLDGERQPLAEIAESAGKIASGKDTQHEPNFCIVARVDALIAGWGMDEALRRAEAYRRAGAEAILIHSKLSKPEQIVTFTREWAGRAPLVIVPTKYYSTPTEVFRKSGISMVIWANHLVRAATAAMQSVAKEIQTSETLVNVEDRVAAVNEIFRLQYADEYSAAERLYLSASESSRSAVVLAASRGRGLDAMTTDRPKVMLPIAGEPASGRWIGLLNVSRGGLVKLKAVMAELRKRPDFDTLDMPALMNALIADGAQIEVLYVHGHWRGVNDLEDFRQAVDFAHSQTPFQ